MVPSGGCGGWGRAPPGCADGHGVEAAAAVGGVHGGAIGAMATVARASEFFVMRVAACHSCWQRRFALVARWLHVAGGCTWLVAARGWWLHVAGGCTRRARSMHEIARTHASSCAGVAAVAVQGAEGQVGVAVQLLVQLLVQLWQLQLCFKLTQLTLPLLRWRGYRVNRRPGAGFVASAVGRYLCQPWVLVCSFVRFWYQGDCPTRPLV